jgi:23S rRNA pseudouridine2605 synthase
MTDTDDQGNRGGERIAKVIARAGLASRREAEEWIAAGRIAVNGTVVQSPALNVTASDRISVDGTPLPAPERTRLFLYHKPRGLLTSRTDPQGRPTIFQRLPTELPRLISIGRLDFNTEGLILLTNDGALARVLELPATGWLRRYRVRAHGSVTQQKLNELRSGVTIDGVHYREIEATLDRLQGSNLWLSFAIREGKNREVRNVLGHLGLSVTRLIRVSFGPFQLGELAEGAVEEVPTRTVREQLGERVVAQSGADFSAPIAARPPLDERERPGLDQQERPRRDQQQRPGRDERERPRRDERQRSARPPSAGQKSARDQPKGRKPARHKSPSHSWRLQDEERPAKKLHRKFHGARRDDAKRGEHAGRPTGASHAGELADRKGRRVMVERFGHPPPVEQTKAETPKGRRDGRRGRRVSSDRASGPRPRHPRRPRGD